MMPVRGAEAPDAIECILVADVTAQRITGVRRIDDDSTLAHDPGRAPDEPQLGIFRMKLEILTHGPGRYDTRPISDITRMQTIIEFAPWLVFGLVYKFGGGIYPATGALMAAMALLLAYDWATTRKLPQMHLVLAVLVWVFGTATLVLHDVRFLQWKASVFYWIAGLVFVGSAFFGKQTLLQRMLGSGLPEDFSVPASAWRNNSVLMGAFYISLGVVNIWVALNRSEAQWVLFKVWIAPPVAIVFTLAVVLWVLRGLFARQNVT